MKEHELKWYDHLYSEGGDWSSFVEEDAAYMLDLSLSKMTKKSGLSLLDIGCGAGGFLAKARRTGIRNVMGTDISPSALRRAKDSLREGEYVVADGQHLPFRQEAFDIVACIGTLEHFNDPRMGAKQMCRVLDVRGSCLVVLPNPYFAYTIFCKLLRKYRYQPIEHDLSTSNWKACLQSAGFSVLKIAPANPRSDSILGAKSIPTLATLYPILKPLLGLYDKIRHSMPKLSSYHVIFVLRRAGT